MTRVRLTTVSAQMPSMTFYATPLLLLCCALASAEEEVDCQGMKLKPLRQWLAKRGLKCEGCAEKADYVSLCEANKDAPLKEMPSSQHNIRTPGSDKNADIDDILGNLKGMPGARARLPQTLSLALAAHQTPCPQAWRTSRCSAQTI